MDSNHRAMKDRIYSPTHSTTLPPTQLKAIRPKLYTTKPAFYSTYSPHNATIYRATEGTSLNYKELPHSFLPQLSPKLGREWNPQLSAIIQISIS